MRKHTQTHLGQDGLEVGKVIRDPVLSVQTGAGEIESGHDLFFDLLGAWRGRRRAGWFSDEEFDYLSNTSRL